MADLIALAEKYGFWAVLAVFLLSNLPRLLGFAEKSLAKVWPALAVQRQARQERNASAARRRAEKQERADTILALKEMLRIIRESLRDEQAERRLDKEQLYKIIARYEQLGTQIVEALRDVSDVIRAQTGRLNHFEDTGK